jgi:hypothetical protein
MTVEDVIKLSKAGLSDDVIIAQIKKRPQAFDLSTDQLIQLKAAHVSDRVIEAMTESQSANEKAPSNTGQQAVGKNSATTVSQPNVKPAALGQGPFGFEKGMTVQQVISLVGAGAIKSRKADHLVVTTAPKPHSAFEEYSLAFSPKEGLLKVVAIGKDIETDGYGLELQNAFADMVKGVSAKYGLPETHDRHHGDLFRDADQWMMALLDKDRVLISFWQCSPPVNNVKMIEAEAVASSTSKGYVTVGFEFSGWNEYFDARKAQQDSTY